MTENAKYIRLHSIQLSKVGVLELFIRSNQPPDGSVGIEVLDLPFSVGHTEFDEENRQIAVMVKVEIGTNGDDKEVKHPYSLKVEIIGEFEVGEGFAVKHLDNWARRNAPFILMPYLREHVYALTSKCGFKPLILPLLEVPTLTTDCQS